MSHIVFLVCLCSHPAIPPENTDLHNVAPHGKSQICTQNVWTKYLCIFGVWGIGLGFGFEKGAYLTLARHMAWHNVKNLKQIFFYFWNLWVKGFQTFKRFTVQIGWYCGGCLNNKDCDSAKVVINLFFRRIPWCDYPLNLLKFPLIAKEINFLRVVMPLTNCVLPSICYFHRDFISAKLLSPNKPDLYCWITKYSETGMIWCRLKFPFVKYLSWIYLSTISIGPTLHFALFIYGRERKVSEYKRVSSPYLFL